MDSKTSDWRPGPTVCRCCLTEGCYKDISTEYFWMGKREVYADMLSETFNVSISYSSTGGPNSNSRLICEPCISRLRDASDFRRQVLDCEKTFVNHLNPGNSTMEIQVEMEPVDDVKMERVKLEKDDSDDDYEPPDFPDDNDNDDDDDDDLDDQPLTKLASKMPKKEAAELLELLDNPQLTIKRKSTGKTKEPPKKIKKKEPEPTSSKASANIKKKKADFDPSRRNAEMILRFTSACPFRVRDKAILCVYCQELYDDPIVFRAHMRDEHDTCSLAVIFYNLPKSEFVKADLTDLKCKICSQNFEDLETVANHLSKNHNKEVDFNNKLGVMPYKLKKDVYVCAVCGKTEPSLHHLNRHTITHFLSYVCHVCGSSYIATTGLLRHMRSKHQEYEVFCKRCKKKFPSMEAKERHRRTEKSCMPYSCPHCTERFLDFRVRQKHLESKHGQTKKTYRCVDCDIEFTGDVAYYTHFKLQHAENCASCKHCGMKFVSVYRLKRHLAKHNI